MKAWQSNRVGAAVGGGGGGECATTTRWRSSEYWRPSPVQLDDDEIDGGDKEPRRRWQDSHSK